MATSDQAPTGLLQFGDFTLDSTQGRLFLRDEEIVLRPKTCSVLLHLAANPERLLKKDELLEAVWQGVVVTEDSLTQCISELRAALGDSDQTLIRTVHRRGYCFATKVQLSARAPRGREVPGNVSALQHVLYGRSADVRDVAALTVARRLVTIVGPGGVGKTKVGEAVAQRLARHWPGGAWNVELASLLDPALVAVTVAQALRLELPGLTSATEELADALKAESILLVLDNCEHLLGGVGQLISTLFARAAGVHILVTSQERVNIPSEHVFRLGPLRLPTLPTLQHAVESGAVELFVARAQALDRSFQLCESNVRAVVDICTRLDGLALPIELAAARLPLLGVDALREQLHARLKVLTTGGRLSLRRHQSLQAAHDWSHALLCGDEGVVYRRLAVFMGGFTLSFAQQVVSDETLDEWTVLQHLGGLVEKSLLVANPVNQRFNFLESTRTHARSKLSDSGESAVIYGRHAQIFARWFEYHEKMMLRGAVTVDSWMERARLELDNLRSAVEWSISPSGDREVALRLVAYSPHAMRHHGLTRESMRWICELEKVAVLQPPTELSARYWVALGAYCQRGSLPASRRIDALRLAEAQYKSLGDSVSLACCLYFLSHLLAKVGDLRSAEVSLAEARDLSMHAGSPLLRAATTLRAGGICAFKGQLECALSLYQEALQLFEAAGDSRSKFGLEVEIADLLLSLGRVDDAVLQTQSLAEIGASRYRSANVMALVMLNLTRALLAQGAKDPAQNAAKAAMQYLSRLPGGIRTGADCFAWLAAQFGNYRGAAALVGAGDAWVQCSGERRRLNDQAACDSALLLAGGFHSPTQIAKWRAYGATASVDEVLVLLDSLVVVDK